MTPHEARIYNMAITDALTQYKNGIGAILELKKKFTVTVEHVGHSTKQEVTVSDGKEDS